jgi:mono/diheme cytochrome c family protein
MSKKSKGGLQILMLVTAAGLAALWPLSDRSAPAQENPAESRPEGSVARGRTSFRIYCASCHGAAAQGNGPVGAYLKIPPSDLTQLAAKNKGEFPADRVAASIDGRDELSHPSHGPHDMPVWGMSFQTPGKDSDQEAEVRSRILDLTAFLRSIQGPVSK